ncbi:MAG: circularly permuted type 2 ATP-grasp protein [Alphaproteobacteria bacterium]|nr:circularly permuted type 2 ATP-grasp protein [Alphaproteobacteria bacterium]
MESLRNPGQAAAPAPYDELVTGRHQIRYHWQGLLGTMRALPEEAMRDRVERARRQLAEGGGTRAVAPDGSATEWIFEPLPLIITPPEWETLSAGLVQRARLLDAILGDVYGPQRLLAEHRIPPVLLHAEPRFMRPCRRMDSGGPKRRLVNYAADVVRGADGSWSVLADYTGAPTGAGYALFLRRAMARAMPEAFRSIPVREIAPFFDRWQASLRDCAPASAANPRVALLTSGAFAHTYFEQVFLARTLGITLVEGGDLTVRADGVALKTLEGLKQVDVLLRRLDGAWCDPLELRADSTLGVSGLAGAERTGTVAIANALGSMLAESAALSPFLPSLAPHVLGEDLALPALDVWWLGEEPARREVLARFDSMVVRDVMGADREPMTVRELPGDRRTALLAQINKQPWSYIAQRPVNPSVAPSWSPEGLRPDPVVVRVFLVAEGDSYRVMPGGLGRTAPASPLSRLGRIDGRLRDVWVLAEDDSEVVIPSTARFRGVPIQRGGDVQSRVADNLFWLGRYTERLDNAARLIRGALSRLARQPLGARDLVEVRLLALASAEARLISSQDAMSPPDSAALLRALTRFASDERAFGSALRAISRLIMTLRDRLSADMSATIDTLIGSMSRRIAASTGNVDVLLALLDDTIRMVATVAGLSQENMTRGAGWRFLDLGRRLERAYYVCSGAHFAFTQTPVIWESAMRLALELCDSTITYRGRYLGALEPAPVLDLTLLDESNPRSLAFQVHAIDRHLDVLARTTGSRVAFDDSALLADMRAGVTMFQTDERAWRHQGLALTRLRDTLSNTVDTFIRLSDDLTRTHFSLVPAARRLGAPAE